MDSGPLKARVETSEGGRLRVLSPGVGIWSGHPHAGALLGPGSPLGVLERLQRRQVLYLPEGAAGRLVTPVPRRRALPVEYGQLLFELAPLAGDDQEVLERDGAMPGHAADASIPPGHRAVTAPTDGVFYSRPSPDAEPFVHPGSQVRTGQPLGLIEVMKTFNQILYGGPGFADEAEVVEIRVQDAAEIHAGCVLMVVR
jgi:acetyl-CoA carboxylase biotin carboxyl carrier protein